MSRRTDSASLHICSKLTLGKRQCNYSIHIGICIIPLYILMLNWNTFILIHKLNPFTYTSLESNMIPKIWLQIIKSIFLSENLQSARFSDMTNDKTLWMWHSTRADNNGCGIRPSTDTSTYIGTGMSDMTNLPHISELRMCRGISSPPPPGNIGTQPH